MKKHSGFMLIELSLAFALASIVLFYQVKQERDALVEAFAEAQGKQMKAVGDAANAYAVTHYNQVLNNTAVAGVANVRQPSVVELATLGFLPTGYGTQTLYGGGYNINFVLTPAACTLPNCNIGGYLNTTTPFTVDTTVSAKAIGKVLGILGADGGAAQFSGATITGVNNGWTLANPVAGQPRGILAYRLGADSLTFSQFLRRDGSLPMTGNLDMGGRNITNAALVALSAAQTAGAACTTGQIGRDATGELMACVSGAWKQAGGGKWKDPVANVTSLPACNASSSGDVRIALTPSVGSGPRAHMCNGAIWQPLAVSDNGSLTIDGQLMIGDGTAATTTNTLVVNRTATESTACSPNGAVARDANGLILSCQSGVWKKAARANQISCPSGQGVTSIDSNGNPVCGLAGDGPGYNSGLIGSVCSGSNSCGRGGMQYGFCMVPAGYWNPSWSSLGYILWDGLRWVGSHETWGSASCSFVVFLPSP